MNWNIYSQAFTVRTYRKRLSNLNTFLTPHIYWGIHITICVNYNQHMVEVIPVRFPPPASWKRMSTWVLQWLLNSCLKTEALLLSWPEPPTATSPRIIPSIQRQMIWQRELPWCLKAMWQSASVSIKTALRTVQAAVHRYSIMKPLMQEKSSHPLFLEL